MAFHSPERHLLRSEQRLNARANFLTKEEIGVLKDQLRKFSAETPKLKDFSGIYGEEKVAADRSEIYRILESNELSDTEVDKTNKFYGDVLEMIIGDFASRWLPGTISKTNLFDDIKGGIDLVLELDPQTRLALDVTMDERSVWKKINKIMGGYSHSVYPKTKYFKPQTGSGLSVVEMPGVIAGADKDRLIRYAKLFVAGKNNENPETGNESELARVNRTIANDEFGRHLRKEIISQLNLTLQALEQAPVSEKNFLFQIPDRLGKDYLLSCLGG